MTVPVASLSHTRWREWPVSADWQTLVADWFLSAEGRDLLGALQMQLDSGVTIYPPSPLRALQLTPLADVRVVILGQDPYHGPGQAEGLAFSVSPGVRVPPSLRNIHKELTRDLGGIPPITGSLAAWARRGVLLLNTCLTVAAGQPASHAGLGWSGLTSRVLAACNARQAPTVFMLWGNHAQGLRSAIDEGRHLVLTANHPSPLSALRPPLPFAGCGHFGLANAWLTRHGRKEVDWIGPLSKTMA